MVPRSNGPSRRRRQTAGIQTLSSRSHGVPGRVTKPIGPNGLLELKFAPRGFPLSLGLRDEVLGAQTKSNAVRVRAKLVAYNSSSRIFLNFTTDLSSWFCNPM